MPTFFAKHRLEPPGSPGYSQTTTSVSGLGFRSTSHGNGNAPFLAPIRPSFLWTINHLHGGLLFLDLLVLLHEKL